MRCILTTYHILKGLGLENKISIRIEPGLLELGAARFGMSIFLKPIDWHNYGINVDLTYRPIMKDIGSLEREDEYYLRSKYIIREIESRHNNSHFPLLNILIVAHATSPDTLTWDLVGRQPNVYDLYSLSLNIGYLQMVITERKRQNKYWSLTQMPLESTTLKWV
jgi:broad specificity phosphatase PhoE